MTTTRKRQLSLGVLASVAALVACDGGKVANDAHRNAGLELVASNPDKALEHFAKISSNDDPSALWGQAMAYEAKHDWKQAESLLQRALTLAPRRPDIRTTLARLYLLQRRWDDAQREALEVLAHTANAPAAIGIISVTAASSADERRALAALDGLAASTEHAFPAEYRYLQLSLAESLGLGDRTLPLLAQAQAAALSAPDDTLVWASAALERGKHALAAHLLRLLAQSALETPERLFTTVRLALDMGEQQTARALLTRVPNWSTGAVSLGLAARCDMLAGQFLEAAKKLDAALVLEKRPEARKALTLALAHAKQRTGQPEEAAALLNDLARAEPKDAELALALAELDIARGHTVEAVERLKVSSAEHEGNAVLLSRLGDAQVGAKQLADAEKTFTRLLEHYPDDQNLRHRLVLLLALQGRLEASLDMLATLAAPSFEVIDPVRNLALGFVQSGAAKQVMGMLRERAKSGDHLVLDLLLASLYQQTSEPVGARKVLEHAVEMHRASMVAHAELASWHERSGDLVRAIAVMREAVAMEPQSVVALGKLAGLYERSGRTADAARTYEQLARIDTANVMALNNAAMLLTRVGGDPERAVDLARQAHAIGTGGAGVADTLAWALLERGREEDLASALDLLASANNTLNHPELKYHYGVALARNKQPQLAAAMLNAALSAPTNFESREDAKRLLAKLTSAESPKP